MGFRKAYSNNLFNNINLIFECKDIDNMKIKRVPQGQCTFKVLGTSKVLSIL